MMMKTHFTHLSAHQPRAAQRMDMRARSMKQSSSKDAYESYRRSLLVALPTLLATLPAIADDTPTTTPTTSSSAVTFDIVHDETLAYDFKFPTSTSSGKPLSLVFSRRPEKYSSAAPLSADARQRIVCELVDLAKAFTVSVSVGPPGGILSNRPQNDWKPREVAEQVLVDRSTARVTTGQRVALNSIEKAEAVPMEDGNVYYFYEHISQGSPSIQNQRARETFRHAFSVTAVRKGMNGTPFLYTMNVSAPEEIWGEVEGGAKEAVTSFRLGTPGGNYVSPDKDPWMFF